MAPMKTTHKALVALVAIILRHRPSLTRYQAAEVAAHILARCATLDEARRDADSPYRLDGVATW